MSNPIHAGLFLCLLLIVSSCSSPAPVAALPPVNVYVTSAAQPWLADVYECAAEVAVIFRVDDPSAADLALQVGETEFQTSFAYPIDEEEIMIVTQRQGPVQNLTLEQAQNLFAGLGDPSLQVWVYAPGDDIFGVFDRFVMKGRSVAPSARVAVNPQQMSDVINAEPSAVGILPRHWKAGDVREVYPVGSVPVLAITQGEPQGVVSQLIGCLQK